MARRHYRRHAGLDEIGIADGGLRLLQAVVQPEFDLLQRAGDQGAIGRRQSIQDTAAIRN